MDNSVHAAREGGADAPGGGSGGGEASWPPGGEEKAAVDAAALAAEGRREDAVGAYTRSRQLARVPDRTDTRSAGPDATESTAPLAGRQCKSAIKTASVGLLTTAATVIATTVIATA